MTGCAWYWQFYPGFRTTNARVACDCGWHTTVMRLPSKHEKSRAEALQEMKSLEMIAKHHTRNRAWDVYYNSRYDVPA